MSTPIPPAPPDQEWTYVDLPYWTATARWPALTAISLWVHAHAGWPPYQMAVISMAIVATFTFMGCADWQDRRATRLRDAPTIEELR